MSIIDQYLEGTVKGWPGFEKAEEEFPKVAGLANFQQPVQFIRDAGKPRYSVNYKICRRVNGEDPVNIAQEDGDCVSWGARRAILVTGCSDIAVRGDTEKFSDPYPPYVYGTSRVQIGNGRLGSSAGSLGSWAAAAVMKYGTVYFDTPGVPKYSGKVAQHYGLYGPPQELLNEGKQFLIKSAVAVKTWDQALDMVLNGYGGAVASGLGFEMTPDKNGFHRRSPKEWQHQMGIVDMDDEWTDPYVVLGNSWADVHGKLFDFRTKEQLPVGFLRIHRRDFEEMLNTGEVFFYCQYDAPVAQEIPEFLFKAV